MTYVNTSAVAGAVPPPGYPPPGGYQPGYYPSPQGGPTPYYPNDPNSPPQFPPQAYDGQGSYAPVGSPFMLPVNRQFSDVLAAPWPASGLVSSASIRSSGRSSSHWGLQTDGLTCSVSCCTIYDLSVYDIHEILTDCYYTMSPVIMPSKDCYCPVVLLPDGFRQHDYHRFYAVACGRNAKIATIQTESCRFHCRMKLGMQ